MKAFVTGAAGFIGSNLCKALLKRGDDVIGYDNFSSGFREFIAAANASDNFTLIEGDVLDSLRLKEVMRGCDVVYHLAANADVRFGTSNTGRDLEQNTIATYKVLEAMRSNNVGRIAFSSTGSVYGECSVIPTPENAPFPIQTSLYGASKVAGEALISAYCEGFGMQGTVFRFVSILGPHYTHGHIFDFYKQLRNDATSLKILGDGRQRKSYLHVKDCVDAILVAMTDVTRQFSIFNLGHDSYCEVNDSVDWITDTVGLKPERKYTGGRRGWIGDNPFILLDCSKIRGLGWAPVYSIEDGVRETVRWLQENAWVLERRS